MPPLYSHSRLSCFENCPKQFHYRYVLKLPAESESIEAFLGKRVHEVLERLQQFADRGLVPSLAKVVSRFRVNWEERYDPSRVRIVRQENDDKFYLDIGERCLDRFYRQHYPFDADETLGLEQHVRFDLDAERGYRLRGIIDRLVRARDGAIEIHDYKTSQRIPSQKRLDADRQLALYQLAVAREYPERPFRLVWHYLVFGATRVSTRSAEQLERLRSDVMDLIGRIEREEEYPARPSPLCGWCEYGERCPASGRTRAASPAPPPSQPAQRSLL